METISDISAAFGSQRKMADAVGVTRGMVEQWCQRDTIPAKWLLPVVRAAEARDIPLTLERLAQIVAEDDHSNGEAA